jgi:hypothetical protein
MQFQQVKADNEKGQTESDFVIMPSPPTGEEKRRQCD